MSSLREVPPIYGRSRIASELDNSTYQLIAELRAELAQLRGGGSGEVDHIVSECEKALDEIVSRLGDLDRDR